MTGTWALQEPRCLWVSREKDCQENVCDEDERSLDDLGRFACRVDVGVRATCGNAQGLSGRSEGERARGIRVGQSGTIRLALQKCG